jgi:hypothetical protein
LSELKGKMTHPDSQDLAEFRAGLITGRRGARISAHLAACERCAGLCDQLAEVSVLLAAVPVPAMPDAVARRLEGVLAAESARRDHAERIAGDSSRDRAPDPRPRRGWDFRLVTLRVLAPAAAVAVLAAGGYGLSRIGGGSTPSAASGSAASSTATRAAGAQARPQARPAGPAGSAGSASRYSVVAPLVGEVVTSQTNYQRGTLRQQLADEMRRNARDTAGSRGPASKSLEECVLRVAGAEPGAVKLVEKARFEGQPAIVIVAASGRHDTAWVTTANCGRILATTTLPGTTAS